MLKLSAGDQRVAQRVLLVEEAGIGAGFDVVPGAPFVDDQADRFCGSYLSMIAECLRDELVHLQRVAERGEPVVFVEAGGGALGLPSRRSGSV